MQLKTAFMILYLFPTTSWRLIFGVTLNVSEHFFFLSAKGKCAKNELVSSIGRGGGRAGEAEAPLNEKFFFGGGGAPTFRSRKYRETIWPCAVARHVRQHSSSCD